MHLRQWHAAWNYTGTGKKSTQSQKNTNDWRYPYRLRQGRSIHLDTFAKQKYAGAKCQIYIQSQKNICKVFSEESRNFIPSYMPVTSKLLWITLTDSHS